MESHVAKNVSGEACGRHILSEVFILHGRYRVKLYCMDLLVLYEVMAAPVLPVRGEMSGELRCLLPCHRTVLKVCCKEMLVLFEVKAAPLLNVR